MDNMNKRPLMFISTEGYPYVNFEAPFIEPELEELLKNYEVTFISHVHDDKCEKIQWDEKTGVKAFNINIKLNWFDRIKYFIRFLLDVDGRKEIRLILKEKKNILSRVYQSAGFFALAVQNYRMMMKKKILPQNEEFIYYSYWYYYYTYSMTKYKNKFPKAKIVTRTHGFDLYDERYTGNRQPLKNIMEPCIDRIAFISEQGKNYYLKKYNLRDGFKYCVNRLGTRSVDFSSENQKKSSGKYFRLASCSSLIPLKRVDLLIKSLSLLDEYIEWIHFGSGTEFEDLLSLANELLKEKKNISYSIKGFTPNQDVLEYYKLNYINCFISTSSTEGIPVSIQEAMAFGIPVIATNVGGVSELFEDNGILLKADPTPNEVASAIRKMIYMDRNLYQNWRENSYKVWNERYNAKTNSKVFVEMLKSM